MWGRRANVKISEFFKGRSIFETLSNSMFGKFKEVLNKLFEGNTPENYELPKVIVIGMESTGKSSLLENITKCNVFPRDHKLCTRCPVHLKLSTGKPKYFIKYFDDNDKECVINVQNKNDIYKEVQNIFNKYPADVISDKEIVVNITDENVPNFEFFDLPGIRSYPPDLAEKTIAISKKYLEDKNSIVICVVPSTTTRLTSCQSIALILETNMKQNCILALTMADRLQPENVEDLLISRIIGTSDEIQDLGFAGYVAIVNRTHTDGKSLDENDTAEVDWFNNNILTGIPTEYTIHVETIKNNVTVSKLLSKMDNLYNKFIHSEWKPRVLNDIQQEIGKVQKEIENLGDPTISSKDFNEAFKKYIEDNLIPEFLPSSKYEMNLTPNSDMTADYKKYEESLDMIKSFIDDCKNEQTNKFLERFQEEFNNDGYSDKKYYKFSVGIKLCEEFLSVKPTSKDLSQLNHMMIMFLNHLNVFNIKYELHDIDIKLDEIYNLLITRKILSNPQIHLSASETLFENETFAKQRESLVSRLTILTNDLKNISSI